LGGLNGSSRAELPGGAAGLVRRRLLREWRGREGRVQFLPFAGVDFESGNAQQFPGRFHSALVSGPARIDKATARMVSDYNNRSLTTFPGP